MYHIIGHKNPDSDAVLSALIAKEYFIAMGMEAEAYRLGDLNKETDFVLKSIGIEAPKIISTLEPGSEVVLVDHNSVNQTIDGIETLRIKYIIDHHRVENLSSDEPIQLRFDPICSTCSILFLMFAEQDLEIPDHVAKMILAGILSDSLAFRSPTTTDEDREIAGYLAEDLGIDDVQAYAKAMFDAKSDLGDMPTRKILELDYKVFTFGGDKKYGYGVMETTSPNYAMSRKGDIIADMQKLKEETGLHAIFFSVVDILAEKNTTFVAGDIESEALRVVFGAETQDMIADLGKRMSRKKELEPLLTAYFEKK
ncbi:manganese-dependent inorganic pyrophosphatase [Candidatus Gracilibacteria bacterium]|nr:manganese-dependent inorganic pyrophosphatase [Candidatus Gracilibacteria bacterium]